MTGGQQYWPEVWAMAAAWREQLGDGEAGVGRLPRGRVGRGYAGWVDGVGSEGEGRGWAALQMTR